jgi:hypothetical protein
LYLYIFVYDKSVERADQNQEFLELDTRSRCCVREHRRSVILCTRVEMMMSPAYAAKSFTTSQTNYPQIEKEASVLKFACTKFHEYIYGKQLLIETDHKPLVSIFKKNRWLDEIHEVFKRMKKHWNFREELTCYYDFLFKGDRIIIPRSRIN